MVIVAKTSVLVVGIDEKAEALRELPIRLICLEKAREAAGSLKNEQVHSVISHWRLADMPDGFFLKGLRKIRPQVPTIAIVEANNPDQEIQARSLGVTAVITEDCPEEIFREIVCEVLGLTSSDRLQELYAVNDIVDGK